jgi:hypothetical protein
MLESRIAVFSPPKQGSKEARKQGSKEASSPGGWRKTNQTDLLKLVSATDDAETEASGALLELNVKDFLEGEKFNRLSRLELCQLEQPKSIIKIGHV